MSGQVACRLLQRNGNRRVPRGSSKFVRGAPIAKDAAAALQHLHRLLAQARAGVLKLQSGEKVTSARVLLTRAMRVCWHASAVWQNPWLWRRRDHSLGPLRCGAFRRIGRGRDTRGLSLATLIPKQK